VGVRKLNVASIFEILDWGSVADAAEADRLLFAEPCGAGKSAMAPGLRLTLRAPQSSARMPTSLEH
jgi:hypothetical protein